MMLRLLQVSLMTVRWDSCCVMWISRRTGAGAGAGGGWEWLHLNQVMSSQKMFEGPGEWLQIAILTILAWH